MSGREHGRSIRAAAHRFARGAAMLALIVAGALTPAAPASARPGTVGRVVFGPPPAAARASAAAAVSPTISPTPRRTYHAADGDDWECPPGNLCLAVRDPTAGDWKVFDLYTCNRYYFADWENAGLYLNHQTGGVTSHIYNQSGGVLHSFTPDWPTVYSYNWTPAWSARNC